MKLLVIVILFSAFTSQLNSQIITGKVVDSCNDEPLAYASIGVIETPIGTITDENGNFKIDVTGQPLNAIIRISFISFQAKKFTIEELMNNKNTIKLISYPMQLAEVVIRPSGKLKDVGTLNNIDSHMFVGWGSNQYGTGQELGLKIELGDLPVKFINLHILVAKQSFDTCLFRLHVRNIVNKMPAEELLGTNILFTITKSSGLVDIDLNKYDLVFKGNVALSIEWIKSIGIQDKFMSHKKSKLPPMPVVYFKCSKQGYEYYRRGIENKWVGVKKQSPFFYLTVQE